MNHLVDKYIENAAEFAKPILHYFRKQVHAACPQIEEKIKWGVPFFDYKGPYCGMAAFKAHCRIVIIKAALLKDSNKFDLSENENMGSFGLIKSLSDLPPAKQLQAYLKEAAILNEMGIKAEKVVKKKTPALETPEYFAQELRKNKKAFNVFENFAPSHRKEYILWITEAKTDDTRNRRIAQALEWIADGKGRNWKYEKR